MWLAAQDQVFSNCSGGAIIPEPLPKGYPSEQTDRAYQIAAAHFYAGQWDEAQKEFEAIGKDPYSPYHTLAPYLAVRVLIRKASFLPDTDMEGKKALLTTAHDRLAALAHEPGSASIQEDVVRLQNLVKIELDPVSREKELAELLVKPDPALYQDLWDFVTYLYPGNVVPIHTNGIKPGDADLADWVIELGDQNAVAFANIMAKWKARGSIPWLVAAITRVEPRAPEAKELLEAAGKVPPGSPAYPSLAYHSVCIFLATGRVEEAQKVLNLLFEKVVEALRGRGAFAR